MQFVWELIAAPIALIAALLAFWANQEGFGLTFLVASGGFLATGMARRRRQRQIQRDSDALSDKQADLIARLDRGESLEQIARDYQHLYQVPITQMLLRLGDWLLRIIATQPNAQEKQELCRVLKSHQVLEPLPPPKEMIQNFNFNESVYLVHEDVDAAAEDRWLERFSGILIIARVYIYFITAQSAGDKFFKSYTTHGLVHLVPYLSVAHAGFELVHGMHEMLAQYFSPALINELKHHFAPPSFAIPLRAITAIQMIPGHSLEPVRLVIQSTDQKGTVQRWHFATQVSMTDSSVHCWIDVLRAACVSQGVFITG